MGIWKSVPAYAMATVKRRHGYFIKLSRYYSVLVLLGGPEDEAIVNWI